MLEAGLHFAFTMSLLHSFKIRSYPLGTYNEHTDYKNLVKFTRNATIIIYDIHELGLQAATCWRQNSAARNKVSTTQFILRNYSKETIPEYIYVKIYSSSSMNFLPEGEGGKRSTKHSTGRQRD